jgi:hypothetical protein
MHKSAAPDIETVPIYLRISKTLKDRLDRCTTDAETVVRLGLLIYAMPDGSVITRRKASILGVDTETLGVAGRPANQDAQEVVF